MEPRFEIRDSRFEIRQEYRVEFRVINATLCPNLEFRIALGASSTLLRERSRGRAAALALHALAAFGHPARHVRGSGPEHAPYAASTVRPPHPQTFPSHTTPHPTATKELHSRLLPPCRLAALVSMLSSDPHAPLHRHSRACPYR
jgi:hypothetical protein